MKPIINVRRYEDKDGNQMREVIKSYVLSKVTTAFVFCLFREITLQLIVLLTAILFIFFGLPLLYCVLSFPIVVVLTGICVYCVHYNKAIDLLNLHTPICFVAVIYEPLAMRLEKQDLEYIEMTDSELKEHEQDLKKLRRPKVVGTISIRNHHSLHESGWIYRLAVDPSYSFNQVARPLIITAMQHAYGNNLYTVESVVAECHEDFRELLIKIGFNIRQIYHKSLIGSSLRVMKAQMGIDLQKYFKNQKSKKSSLNY